MMKKSSLSTVCSLFLIACGYLYKKYADGAINVLLFFATGEQYSELFVNNSIMYRPNANKVSFKQIHKITQRIGCSQLEHNFIAEKRTN